MKRRGCRAGYRARAGPRWGAALQSRATTDGGVSVGTEGQRGVGRLDDAGRGLAAVGAVRSDQRTVRLPGEQRELTAHVTVGRAPRARRRRRPAALDEFAGRDFGGTTVDEVHVYESRLGAKVRPTFCGHGPRWLPTDNSHRRHDMATTRPRRARASRTRPTRPPTRIRPPAYDPRARSRP